MTTVLFFQDLAWVSGQWRFANSMSVPDHIDTQQWNEGYANWYGLFRGSIEIHINGVKI